MPLIYTLNHPFLLCPLGLGDFPLPAGYTLELSFSPLSFSSIPTPVYRNLPPHQSDVEFCTMRITLQRIQVCLGALPRIRTCLGLTPADKTALLPHGDFDSNRLLQYCSDKQLYLDAAHRKDVFLSLKSAERVARLLQSDVEKKLSLASP